MLIINNLHQVTKKKMGKRKDTKNSKLIYVTKHHLRPLNNGIETSWEKTNTYGGESLQKAPKELDCLQQW